MNMDMMEDWRDLMKRWGLAEYLTKFEGIRTELYMSFCELEQWTGGQIIKYMAIASGISQSSTHADMK